MVNQKRTVLLSTLLLCALLLSGCGSSDSGTAATDPDKAGVTHLELTLDSADELYKLAGYPDLESVDLSGSRCYDAILDWAARNPQVAVRYTVTLPDGQEAANDSRSLDLSGLSDKQLLELLPDLRYLPELTSLELGSGGKSVETLQELARSYPDVKLDYRFTLNGKPYSLDETGLDLSEGADAQALLPWLPCMTSLRWVELGSGDAETGPVDWQELAAMEQAAPWAEFRYAFTLYGKDFTLQDSVVDLNHIKMQDQGELVLAVASCMPKLSYLDMDFCEVDDEHMVVIRDALPQAQVVWRIWFGRNYTARTDTERILASNPDRGGDLTKANTEPLKYCTKVKYLDLGHNLELEDISFVSYMPDLEIAVLAMNQWSDARPLLNCPKLEYLEMQTGACSDLRPIAQLKNLKHLNICYCLALRDITPIMDMDLERLWVGSISPVPPEQVEEYHRRHPNCEINTTCVDPTTEGWRVKGWDQNGMTVLDPMYARLRDIFEYDEMQTSYNYPENDPKYYGGWWPTW